MVAIIGLLLALSTVAVLGAPRGRGTVSTVNVGVYLDSSCTVKCTGIDWGNIDPGSAVTKTVYVKNSGSTTLVLQLSTSDWNPTAAAALITLSWSLSNNYRLSAGKVVPVTLTLKAASDTGGLNDFNFVIAIIGTQKK